MTPRLRSIEVENYRSLANVSLDLEPVNVLFGPNGAGKSTLLDVVWFIRDCAIRGVHLASSHRDHGIGLLFDGADERAKIRLKLSTARAEYELTFGFSGGRIEPSVGESLHGSHGRVLIHRREGSSDADFAILEPEGRVTVELREPEKLSLGRFLDFEPGCEEAAELDQVLHHVHLHHSRSLDLHGLKKQGSVAGFGTGLTGRGGNLWSVLRNLEGRRRLDNRFESIMGSMAEAFPGFDGLVIEPTGPSSLYARFLEKGRRAPILATGVSDGQLQLLILLTALFSEDRGRDSLLLIDEPETSLHPWAIAVLAKAINEAVAWGRQVILATHSPVLLSQFEPAQILEVEQVDGRTRLRRLSEAKEVQDLLQDYAAGSLYMSELIGAQSKLAGGPGGDPE